MKTILTKTFLAYIRDKRTTLIVFLSPITFMLILGFIIAGISGGTHQVSVKISVFLSRRYEPLKNFLKSEGKTSGLNFIFVNNVSELKKYVNDGKSQMGISLNSSSMLFIYNQSFGQYNNYLRLIEKSIYHSFKKFIAGVPTYISIEPVSVQRGVNVTVISFIVPGAMAIALMTACVISLALALSNYRANGSLRLLKVTPLSEGMFVFSISLHRLVAAVLSSILTLFSAEWIFSSVYNVHWITFLIIVSTSMLLSLGMGAILSTAFRNVGTTMNFTTVSLTVMMLFSNVFYPFSIMPAYMKFIAYLMPITYFTSCLRFTLGISQMYLGEFIKINVFFATAGLILIYASGKIIFHLERR